MNEREEVIDNVDNEEIEHEEELEQPNPKTAEDIARASGWKPLEEWEGDPSEWRSAEVFNERGEWIKRHKAQEQRLNELEDTFAKRLENVQKLHKVQLEAQKAELIRKRDDAIDLADRDAALGYQKELDNLNGKEVDFDNTPVKSASSEEQVINNWNAANPWVMGGSAKAAYAKQQFGIYSQRGMPAQQAIAAMEADLAREFPDVNPNRERQPTPEKGTPPGRRGRQRVKLTMADLTSEELKYYRAMPNAWESEEAYCQAVADTRSTQ